ncbi:hypothetical protein C8F01DRAFT_90444 [Mycena amicta]|nr:hypothetical protein C8F01DRAFT_90444 [Mycena amicta]
MKSYPTRSILPGTTRFKHPPLPSMSFNLLPLFALASIPPSCRSTSHCVTNIPNRHPNENSNISLKFGPGPSFKTPPDSLDVPPQRRTIRTTVDGAIVETDGHRIGIISSNHLPLPSMSASHLGLFAPDQQRPRRRRLRTARIFQFFVLTLHRLP